MVNKQYRRGRRFEYEVKRYLEKTKWMVFRTAGSHGLADLIAVRHNTTLLVQCKYGTMPSKKERLNMTKIHFALGDDIVVILAHKKLYKKLEFYKVNFNDEFKLIDVETINHYW